MPTCPGMADLREHMLGPVRENCQRTIDLIKADMLDANQFPILKRREGAPVAKAQMPPLIMSFAIR